MTFRPALLLLATAALAAFIACGDGHPHSPSDPELPPLNLSPSPPEGVAAGRSDITFAKDLPCGDSPRNRFDMLLPQGTDPAPLVVYIHGGGFTTGDKSLLYMSSREWTEGVNPLLDAGVALATLNYRLIDETNTGGVITPLTDAQRCLQVIRAHAEQLGIAPGRVALMGNSAGGGTSLWIGLADERADPASEDPVARQSTRVRAIAGFEVQATYDLFRWADDIFAEFGYTADSLMSFNAGRVLSFYGVANKHELLSDSVARYRAAVDMLDFITPGDPPLWVANTRQPASRPVNQSQLNHHPNHALFLMNAAAEHGIETVFYIPELGIEHPSGERYWEFLLRHL